MGAAIISFRRGCPRLQANRSNAIKTAAKKSKTDLSETTKNTVIEIARLMADTKCTNVRVLDLRGVSPMCDYFILGTGTSGRQMKSVADEVAEFASEHGLRSFGQSTSGENWIAIDLVDAIIHLFSHDARMFYDLDNLWGDADDVDWKR